MSYILINALGFDELLSRILAGAGSINYLIFACLAYFLVERIGRRKLLIGSSIACCICWVVISITLGLSETGRGDAYKLNIVAVSFFFAFFSSFGIGLLGGPWYGNPWKYPYFIIYTISF